MKRLVGIGVAVISLALSAAGLILLVGEPDDGTGAAPRWHSVFDPPDIAADDPATAVAPSADPYPFFRSTEEAEVDVPPLLKFDTPERQLVRFSHRSDAWRVGDHIEVIIPQRGSLFQQHIERIHAGGAGRRSFLGQLEPDVPYSRFIVTIGPSGRYASISSSGGAYELVANGELGWLIPRTAR